MITQVEDTTGAANWYMCNTNGPYEFALPTALAFDRGLIFVANSSGNSVTIMNSSTGAYVNRLT
jgi:hypothetical protein